jgi:hypothetical protein
MRWAGREARIGERRCACRVLVGEPDRNRPLGRIRHRRGDNIKMHLRGVVWEGVYWIYLVYDREKW